MKEFWAGKRVFVTGHTGFKGSWLTIWLHSLGAEVYGYSLPPTTSPNLFEIAEVEKLVKINYYHDICDLGSMKKALQEVDPHIIFHLAAQALVIEGYEKPVETYMTNVMGTIHLLEGARSLNSVKAIVNVTTDKSYDNKEWVWSYREIDRLGGFDPYSNSKACSELVTSSYINSFFTPERYSEHGVAIATARAGNVIGGGDWSDNRLVPDIIQSIVKGKDIVLRNPDSVRPWQHVLEPLSGYLQLAEQLYTRGISYSGAWNFGPDDHDCKNVRWITETLIQHWGISDTKIVSSKAKLHEANMLKLDCSKAKSKLNWYPCWDLDKTLHSIVDWNKEILQKKSALVSCVMQIREFESDKGIGA